MHLLCLLSLPQHCSSIIISLLLTVCLYVLHLVVGVVPIVHNSGGPKADIVKPEMMQHGWQTTGYLCTTEEEYAAVITQLLCMEQKDRLNIAAAARQ